jgi:recombination protein RecR
MQILPKALQEVIEAFANLPGVGTRTAERYGYMLIRRDPKYAKTLSRSLETLHDSVKYCPITFALIDADIDVSPLYTDAKRDKKTIAVVAEPFDIMALEKTASFSGTYHVLGGLVSPIDGVGPEDLHIKELVRRIQDDEVTEIILATNASVEGESTALFIQQQLEGSKVRITRLARGLPIGADLEYADQITLSRALEGRQTF